jgi:hypothetical protein
MVRHQYTTDFVRITSSGPDYKLRALESATDQIIVGRAGKDGFSFDKAKPMVKIEAISPVFRPKYMDTVCKHPKVRIVAREDEVEYLECLECGEVFDSEELRDITDTPPGPAELEDEA